MRLQGERRVVVDPLAMLWIVLALLIFLWTSTFVDTSPALAVKSLIGFSLLIAGLFMSGSTVGIQTDPAIDRGEWESFTSLVGLSLLAVMILNAVTLKFLGLEVTHIPRSLFAVLIGVSEEALFRGFILTWILAMTGSTVAAVLASSLLFTVYHGAVYGLSQAALFIVFGSGVILGVAFALSRRLSVTMTAHGVINLLAFLMGG
jgi:membrane protease YdiL (CAAX protease family)